MTEGSNPNDKDSTFFQHLLELKSVLLRSVIAILAIFVCLFPFANEIYSFVANPIISQLPDGQSLISVGVISPFLTPLKMSLIFALYIAMPYILWNFWGFIAPALYEHEKKFVIPMSISTGILFYCGVLFSFYIVFPVIFGFLIDIGPSVVDFTPDIQYYLDFVLKVSFAFGVAFEVPIATILILKFGITTVENLKKNRPYVVIGAFIVGMLLTPPDIISQTMIAIPMWLLFEIGLIFYPILISESKPDEVPDPSNDNTVPPAGNDDKTPPDSGVSDIDSDGDLDDDWDDDGDAFSDGDLDDDWEEDDDDIEPWDGRK